MDNYGFSACCAVIGANLANSYLGYSVIVILTAYEKLIWKKKLQEVASYKSENSIQK